MAEPSFAANLAVLRQGNVARMFSAYLVSNTGTAMAPIAMAFGVLELTGSTADSAIVIAAPTTAMIIVLLVGGVVADRLPRQWVIVCADLLAAAAQATMAWLFLSGNATVPLLTLAMFVNGIAIAFHAPATSGLIIQLVAREHLQPTNALLGTARSGAVAVGAALGGALVAFFGAGWTLALDSLSFALSAALVATTRPRPQRTPEKASMLRDLALGWREFTSHTWLWVIVAQFSLVVAATHAIFGLLGPAESKAYLRGAVDWGIIAAANGVGTMTGGLVALQVRPRHPMRFATCLVFAFAGITVALLLKLPVAAVAGAAFVGGVCGQIFGVIWVTTLQTRIPEQMLSRVTAYDYLGSMALAPLGIVAAGFMYESLGPTATLSVAALIVIVPTALALCVHDVRWMTNAPQPDRMESQG